PYAALGVNALAADTIEQAQHIAKPRNLWVTQLLLGSRGRFISPEMVDAHPFTLSERGLYARIQSRGIIGTGAECHGELTALGAQHAVDEFILLTITYAHADRVRSYELIAAAFGLKSD
ncbi:MAG: LLM class flavin-dependent oxidoreductase, partial [Alphaproteobacteria bacterium]|nr:LLM class flavin-dependent oxidoreductase [Alphaproteobacteria bacterium]